MHTRHFRIPRFCPDFQGTEVLLAATLCWILAVTPFVRPPSAYGQEGRPSSPPSTNLRMYPTDFWGPRVGVGVGLGLVGHRVVGTRDQWLLTAAPARHEQAATVSVASAAPDRANRYVLVDARGLHSDRDWIGPWTLDRSSVQGRLRVGQRFFGSHLLLQPHVSVRYSRVTDVGIRNADFVSAVPLPGPERPSTASRTGLRSGIELSFDSRHVPRHTAAGLLVQARWDRYTSLGHSGLRFGQGDVDLYGYLPLYEWHRLVLRLSATTTQNRGSASLPITQLPTVGGPSVPGWARARFVGPDRAIGSLLYRFPIWRFGRVAAVEGHIGGHLANVYADVWDQFTPDVRFDEGRGAGPDVPLRPAASIGLRLSSPIRDHVSVEVAVGLSPDGWSAAQFRFVQRLSALRLPHHSSDPVR